jgi:molybdate transport system ATP-binding protein
MRNLPAQPADAIVTLQNVALRSGTKIAFPRTNWVVRIGEQWAILGPNNSGKSLLAAALAGDVLPVRGEVSTREAGMTDSPVQKAVVLVSPHTHRAVATAESSFYQSRWHSGLGEGRATVSRFLSQEQVEEINPFEVNPRRTPRSLYLARRRAGIRLLRIGPLLRRKIIGLSNGEMRRTLLARALIHAPRLLVLDEPFAGLDVETRRHVARVVERLMRDGKQMVIATARPDEIPAVTTHLLLVDDRRIIARGTRGVMIKHQLVSRLRAAAQATTTPSRRPKVESRPFRRAASPPLVEIQDATIRFGAKRILDRVSWTICRGERWTLLGPNGSGKTTLLSLIQGDNPQAYAQDIRLFGSSPDSTQALWRTRRQIGWFSPEMHLHYPLEWSCCDVVCSGFFDSIGVFEPCTSHQRRQAGRVLKQFGLGHRARTPLGDLSMTDQRLVLLARALVKRPQLLVLDEPCQALDSAHRRLILAAVDRMAATSEASLIFVTHHRREIPACITHLLRLKSGRVVYRERVPSKDVN